jgi:catechol 2,3-dioxygenase-like lactoylglutathione lyase family enzyme
MCEVLLLHLASVPVKSHSVTAKKGITMSTPIVGLHHVTAIASDPQRNLDFYTQVPGLRFVKRTINFDDPGTYHFYFGDDVGAPGTILTFFPWPHASKGCAGAGEVVATAFSIPVGSFEFWAERLRAPSSGRRLSAWSSAVFTSIVKSSPLGFGVFRQVQIQGVNIGV